MFSIERLQAGLNTKCLGREVKYLDITPSTNDDTWECYQNNNPEGTLIIAGHQSQGRGRRQSKWSSTQGKSLTFSFLLLPEIEIEKLGILPLLTGISIVQGIHRITHVLPGLKWPNDIMISQKKIGGILIESRTGEKGLGLVVGIGLNINESEDDIPGELQDTATSLHIDSGEEFGMEIILSSILNEFEKLYFHHWNDIILLWQKYCIHENDEVSFHSNDKFHKGTFHGITESGHAQIQINGKTETFPAGIITL